MADTVIDLATLNLADVARAQALGDIESLRAERDHVLKYFDQMRAGIVEQYALREAQLLARNGMITPSELAS